MYATIDRSHDQVVTVESILLSYVSFRANAVKNVLLCLK